jgi:hypothetical protein
LRDARRWSAMISTNGAGISGVMLTVMLVACTPPAAGPGDPPTQKSAGTSQRSCDRGRVLSDDQAREWERKWAQVEAARKDSASAGQGSPACSTIREFVSSCPGWIGEVSTAYGELCRAASVRTLPSASPSAPQKEGCPAAWIATKEAGRVIRPDIDALLRGDLGLSGLKDPNDARGAIGRMKSQMKLYHCYDEDAAKELDPCVEKWVTDTGSAIDEEIKCRASDECRARRIAASICATIADKREAQQQMATERRNPGGVVDLQVLHDLGERIQIDDGNITKLRADYAGLAKKTFSEALCK